MKRVLGLGLLLILVIGGTAQAAPYYVDAASTEGNNVGDGSAGNPWQTITYALTQTVTSDTIMVRPGVYSAGMSGSSETFPLDLSKRSLLATVARQATVESSGAVTFDINGDATIEGLGIFCYGSTAILGQYANNLIVGCLIAGDDSSGTGGLAFSGAGGGGVTLASCEVRDFNIAVNLQSNGGGPVTLSDNYIHSNLVGDVSVALWTGTVNLLRNVLTGVNANYAAVQIEAGSPTVLVQRNVIKSARNIELNNLTAGIVTIESNIISSAPFNNAPPYSDGSIKSYGIYKVDPMSIAVTVDYNDVWNNINAYQGVTAGVNELSQQPRFVDPWNDDFRLSAGSPCLGAGRGGVNMGPFDGSVAGPYLGVSYVNGATGTDDLNAGRGSGSGDPWKTVFFANRYTLDKMNIAAGTYTSTETLWAPAPRWFYGAGRGSTTIEGAVSFGIFNVFANATIEGVTVRGTDNLTKGVMFGRGGNWVKHCLLSGAANAGNTSPIGVGISTYYSTTEPGGVIASSEITGWYTGVSLGGSLRNDTTLQDCYLWGNIDTNLELTNWGTDKNFVVRGCTNENTSNLTTFNNVALAGDNILFEKNEVIGRNSLTYSDRGLYLNNCNASVRISRNTIVKNRYGVYLASNVNATVENCVINGGDLSASRYGFYVSGTGNNLNNRYNNVWQNGIDYSGESTGEGEVSQAPQFLDWANDNYNLRNNSPCINSGDPTAEADPDGTRADIGAHYFDLSAPGAMACYVKTPNGGETLGVSSTKAVTWFASKEGAVYDHMEIYLSTDGGATYPYAVATNEANDGTYSWTVNNLPTTQGRIKVVGVGSLISDESDADFSISDDYYVNVATGSNANSGLSSGQAWQTLTYAATQVATGAIVHTAAGLYNAAAGETFPITLPAGAIFTSEAAPTTAATIDAGTASAHAVVLSAGSILDGFSVQQGVNGSYSGVSFAGSDAILRNCRIDRTSSTAGITAVIINGGRARALVSNNIINNNDTDAGCFGVQLMGGNTYSTIEGNTITANNGVRSSSGDNTVTRNRISPYSNDTNARSGIHLQGTNYTVSSNEVRGYRNTGYAGLFLECTGNVFQNTVVDNTIGMVLRNDLTVKNNIVTNQPRLDAGYDRTSIGITREGGTVTVSYNNVWKVGAAYGGTMTAANNISAFPGFASPESNDYRLQTSNAYWTNPSLTAGESGGYVGAYAPVEAGVPYRIESFISGSGSDTLGNGAAVTTPWRSIFRANKYTVSKINAAAGTYEAWQGLVAPPLYLGINRYLKGADRGTVTIEAKIALGGSGLIELGDNCSLEGVTLRLGAGITPTTVLRVAGSGVIVKNNLISAEGVSSNALEVTANSDRLTVEGNVIWSSPAGGGCNGIQIDNSADFNITRNEIRGRWFAINPNNCTGTNTVNRNTLVKSVYAGLYANNTTVNATNNIFAAEIGGYSAVNTHGIEAAGSGAVNSSYNSFFDNDLDYTGTVNDKTGDLLTNPLFVDATNNNYYLQGASPCRASGTPAGTDRGAYDYYPNFYIDAVNGNNANNGQAWGQAYRNISYALPRTGAGVVVHVAAGTYTEANGEIFPLTLPAGVILTSEAVPTTAATIERVEAHQQEVLLGDNSVIYGFTIKGNCTDRLIGFDNKTGVVIQNNYLDAANHVQGIRGVGDNSVITGNLVWRSSYSSGTSGIYLYAPCQGAQISRNEVRGFESGLRTAGMIGTNSFNRNTLVKNTIGVQANLQPAGTLNLTNNIAAANIGGFVATGSKGIYLTSTGTVNSSYNSLYAVDTTYDGTINDKTGDLLNDPIFVDAANNDYHLLYASPCRASGTPAGTDRGAYDYSLPANLPVVAVLQPNGGESLTGEATYIITWTATSTIGLAANPITLSYSGDGGANWARIASREANDGSYAWTVPALNTTAGRVRVEAADNAARIGTGESAANFTITFATPDARAPIINIEIGGVGLKNGDYIPKQPRIVGIATDEAPGHPWEAKIYLDGIPLATTLNQISEQRLEAYSQVTTNLEGENTTTHRIRVEARDVAGNLGSTEVTGLKVSYGSAQLLQPPVVSEPVFTPTPDGQKKLSVAFTMNQDVDTSIVVVNMSGEPVWTRRFPSGTMGAKAGYNVISFNGISDTTGQPLGKGIYVYQLLAEGKPLGQNGHIVIY